MDVFTQEPLNGAIPIPDDHHYARYVKRTLIVSDSESGVTIVDAAAFRPRPVLDDPGLSGNHVEYFMGLDVSFKVGALHAHLMEVVRLNNKPNGGYGVASVRSVIDAGGRHDRPLRVIKDPLPAAQNHGADESHALIVGIRLEDDLLHATLGKEMTVYHVRDLLGDPAAAPSKQTQA